LVNTGMFWCINNLSRKNNFSKDNKTIRYEYNSYMSLYTLSRDLKISPLSGICAVKQITLFMD